MSPSLQDAAALHRAGHLAEAEAAYRTLLSAEPQDAEALHLLGLLRLSRGDARDAIELLRRAVRADPRLVLAFFHLGSLLAEAGQPSEALANFTKALAIKPDATEIHFAAANALLRLGRIEEAAKAFEQAATLAPNDVETLLNLGSMLQELGRHDEALSACDRALAVAPDHAPAFNNRGNALRLMGRTKEALASFDRAIALKPDHVKARHNRAALLKYLENFDAALAECDRALALDPRYAEAHHLRGTILVALRRGAEALASFDAAIAAQPGLLAAQHGRSQALILVGRFADALANSDFLLTLEPQSAVTHNNRGAALRKLGRFAEAKASFDRAIALQPDLAESYFNRSGPLYELGELEKAHADTRKALDLKSDFPAAASFEFCLASNLCDWTDRAEKLQALTAYCRQGRDIETFAFLHSVDDPSLHLSAAKVAATPAESPLATAPRAAHARLRVAYLSADFSDHPVAHQAVELLECHDQTRFETYGICLRSAPPSPVRQRLKNAFTHFIEAGSRTDRDIARLLVELQIDIAVDLGGYTDGARPWILAHRPAPVTASYLGYPATLGADWMDYIIADDCVIPPGADRFYAEKVVRLPGSFMPRDGTMIPDVPPGPRADEGLPDSAFVLCCFNKSDKITPEIFDIWMRLLRARPDAVLWLNVRNPTARDNLRAEATARQVAPERLVFARRVADRREHLVRLAHADLFVDTLPYNAHATASDFLDAGVPVLTCIGKGFPARVAASLLKARGLDALIAPDLATYESLAMQLMRDPAQLSALRAAIVVGRARMDTQRLARDLEAAYEAMWEKSGLADLSPTSTVASAEGGKTEE